MSDLFSFKYNLDNCRISLPEELKWLEDSYLDYYPSSDLDFHEPDSFQTFQPESLDSKVYNMSLREDERMVFVQDSQQTPNDLNSADESDLKVDNSQEAAVVLQEDSEIISEDTETNDEQTSGTSVNWVTEIDDLGVHIKNTLYDLKTKQNLVDSGTYVKSGPGRKRKFGPKSSKQLKALVTAYFRTNFAQIVSNRRCKKRKDALITIYFRTLKKLTYHLMGKCAAKNMYKGNEVSEYLVAFSESHSSFLFSISEFCESQLLESFVEFIIIYFPVEKASELINILIKQKAWDEGFLRMQLSILKKRDKTSKKNIKYWASNSLVLRQIMQCALEVLNEQKIADTELGEHLINVTKSFLF